MKLFDKYPNKIYWAYLSSNPNAVDLLEMNETQVNWYLISANPNIFEPDFQELSIERTKIILEELMSVAYHPNRIFKDINLDEDMDIELYLL
jgi:hypothetical protein